jgi:hypothetical protein
MTRRKRDKVLTLSVEDWVGTNKQRISPLLDECCEVLIQLALAYRIQNSQPEAKCLRGALCVPDLRRGNRTFRVHQ